MRLTTEQFRAWDNIAITLVGMSGVGKTWLSKMLRDEEWFHYSGDYRIGTRYLGEPIRDNIIEKAMQVPFLRELLRADAINIVNRLTVDNLQPVSSFLGKVGNPEMGGLPLAEFKRRQVLHREAEIDAMRDVPDFMRKARDLLGFKHFLNDAGGSLCELDDPQTLRTLADHTLMLYIQATEEDEQELIHRAEDDPKPLYYREAFLDEQLRIYLEEQGLEYVAMIDPDAFVRWVFPRLFYSRIPRYEAIAREYGYTVTTPELWQVRDESDFLELVLNAIARSDA